MEESININPFNSTHFIWMDFGIAYSVNTKTINIDFTDISDNIKILLFWCLSNLKNENINDYYNEYKRVLAGGLFSGNKENMMKFIELFKNEVTNVLILQRAPLEDIIVSKIIINNPDLFNCYFGTHNSIFSNYKIMTSDFDYIIHYIIHKSVISNNHKYGLIAANQLFYSMNKNIIDLPPHLLHVFLENYFTLLFWSGNTEKVNEITKLYLENLKNKDFYNEYLKEKERMINNFKFANINLDEYVHNNILK
jgi:hypothetical protein